MIDFIVDRPHSLRMVIVAALVSTNSQELLTSDDALRRFAASRYPAIDAQFGDAGCSVSVTSNEHELQF